MWKLHEFRDNNTLLSTLTTKLTATLNGLVETRGKASIAVSGGSTPGPLYTQLSQQELPWSAIKVSLVDERWVDEVHPDSNARLVKHTLLQHHAQRATFVGMKTSANTPESAAETLHGILARHVMPLDLVILGMGQDGHTASFLPRGKGLERALSADCPTLCTAVTPTKESRASPSHARMTLSLNTLLGAGQRILYVTGADKRKVLEDAFSPGPVENLPVRAVLHDSQSLIEVYYAPNP